MRKNDYLLLIFLLFISSMGFFLHGQNTIAPSTVIIQQEEKIIKEIPLNSITKEEILNIPSMHGEVKIKITPTSAAIIESPCPDKICVKAKEITSQGESIVCLPEQILVTMRNPGKEGEIDAILR